MDFEGLTLLEEGLLRWLTRLKHPRWCESCKTEFDSVVPNCSADVAGRSKDFSAECRATSAERETTGSRLDTTLPQTKSSNCLGACRSEAPPFPSRKRELLGQASELQVQQE